MSNRLDEQNLFHHPPLCLIVVLFLQQSLCVYSVQITSLTKKFHGLNREDAIMEYLRLQIVCDFLFN